jgi:hypothetical protein
LEREIERFVRGVGQGTVSVQRLEQEMFRQQKEQQGLQAQYQAVQRQIQEQVTREYDAEIVLRNPQDFQKVFAVVTEGTVDVLRCLIRDIIVYPD